MHQHHSGGCLSKRADRTRRSGQGRPEKRRAVAAGTSRRPRGRRHDGDDAQRRASRRRYVKSKPPKCMPGGRVIPSGEGTLTEVSRSCYVAYGSTIGPTACDVHLVVPVNDELQEVSDGDEEQSKAPAPQQDLRGAGEGTAFGGMCSLATTTATTSTSSSSSPRLDDVGIVPRLSSEVASAQLPMNWYSSRPWNAVEPSVIAPYSHYDPQFQATSDYEGGGVMDGGTVQAEQYQQQQQQYSSGSFSTELSRMRAAAVHSSEGDCLSAPLSPRTLAADFVVPRGGDSSYFNLADALMPETKSNSSTSPPPPPPKQSNFPPPFPPPPPQQSMWDAGSPYRCGMPYGDVPSLPPHQGFSQTMLPPFVPWEGESAPLPPPPFPPFKLPTSFTPHLPYPKHISEISPRSFSLYSDRHPCRPLLQTSPNLLF